MSKKFKRSRNGIFGGVCSGLAEYWSDIPDEVVCEIDPTWVRLGWLGFTFLTGVVFGVSIYIFLWAITSKTPKEC